MEFIKNKIGVILLVLSLIVILAAIWYLMFGISHGSAFEGGVLVEGIKNTGKMISI